MGLLADGWEQVFNAWATAGSVGEEDRAAKRYVSLGLPSDRSTLKISAWADRKIDYERESNSCSKEKRVWRRSGYIVRLPMSPHPFLSLSFSPSTTIILHS